MAALKKVAQLTAKIDEIKAKAEAKVKERERRKLEKEIKKEEKEKKRRRSSQGRASVPKLAEYLSNLYVLLLSATI